MKTKLGMLAARLAILGIFAAVFIAFSGATAFAADKNTISADGKAEEEYMPDMAVISGYLETKDRSAEGAREELARKMAAVKKTLAANKIPDADIKTSGYSVGPDYSWEKGRRVFKGYKGRVSYSIKVKDLDRLSAATDKTIQNGLQINNVSFDLKNREAKEAELLTKATQNAKKRAAAVAAAGGRTLGALISADLKSVSGNTVRYGRNVLMAKAASSDAEESTATEFEAGTFRLTASVSAVFELK